MKKLYAEDLNQVNQNRTNTYNMEPGAPLNPIVKDSWGNYVTPEGTILSEEEVQLRRVITQEKTPILGDVHFDTYTATTYIFNGDMWLIVPTDEEVTDAYFNPRKT